MDGASSLRVREMTEAESGSKVRWVDQQTLAYSRGNEEALVWVDFEPGFFARGRVIYPSSINWWVSKLDASKRSVSEAERGEIVAAVIDYYRQHRRPCRVQEAPDGDSKT